MLWTISDAFAWNAPEGKQLIFANRVLPLEKEARERVRKTLEQEIDDITAANLPLTASCSAAYMGCTPCDGGRVLTSKQLPRWLRGVRAEAARGPGARHPAAETASEPRTPGNGPVS